MRPRPRRRLAARSSPARRPRRPGNRPTPHGSPCPARTRSKATRSSCRPGSRYPRASASSFAQTSPSFSFASIARLPRRGLIPLAMPMRCDPLRIRSENFEQERIGEMSRPHRTGPATLAALAALASIAVFALASCGRGRMPVAAAGESEVKAVVSLERVEVRSGPAGDASRAGTLARGTEVRLRGYSGGIARVLLPSGAEGWLPAGSFERQSDREARRERTDAVARFAPQPGRMLEPTQLFLAPDYGAAQYGRLEEGASLEVLLADHDFYGVLLPGKVLAFVPARSVRLVAPALAPAPTPIQAVAGPPGGPGGQPSFPSTPPAPEVVHQVPYEALPADAEAPVLVTRVD